MSIEYTPGPLLTATRTTPTVLWNDSADPDELRQSISFGCVGATCNPTIAYTCINQKKERRLPRIAEPVAPRIMKTLLSIPEFVRAYEPDGMTPEEFDTYGATVRTLRGFLQADADLDALVRDVIMPQP
ncbi:hypothetical protein AM609_02315 [Actinomyces sp. oral taxon 414]|uniref:hypothetical protein n=1 Tax=Actinomyces TaxID=1654 RepID=UPI00040C43BB|nr:MULTISPECIES: hypothetical protein [Actinomyces]ALC98603.1 hypothetical protein AM609_02315 [Actinomyces sp. oral taxon 414]